MSRLGQPIKNHMSDEIYYISTKWLWPAYRAQSGESKLYPLWATLLGQYITILVGQFERQFLDSLREGSFK